MDGISYSINTDTNEASVEGFAQDYRPTSSIYIRDNVNGYPVTSIIPYAFSMRDEADGYYIDGSLILGKNITTIGEWAFSGISFSEQLTLPESLEEIGDYAFDHCRFKGELKLPNTLKTIGHMAFCSCNFSGNLTLPNSITSIGSGAFMSSFRSDNGYVEYLGTLTLPDSLKVIEAGTFDGCQFSGSLVLPSTLISIGNNAFSGCHFTDELILPKGLKEIGDGAFSCNWPIGDQYNSKFTTIIALSDTPPICRNTVDTNGRPVNIFYSTTLQYAHLIVPDNSLSSYINAPVWREFRNISSSSTTCIVDIDTNKYLIDTNKKEATVLGIADGNFLFHDLIIPDYIVYNGEQVAVVDIAANAFSSLNFSGRLSIGKNVTSIGYRAFKGCSRLHGDLNLSAHVTYIGAEAFMDCSNLDGKLTLPDRITEIGRRVFRGCLKLSGMLRLPAGLTKVGEGAFYGCSGFSGELLLPSSLIQIEESAFYGCSGLSGSLIIPQTVKVIDVCAFTKCVGLDGKLSLPKGLSIIEAFTFSGCSFSGVLELPSTINGIDDSAFQDCKFTGILEIPDSIKWIGEFAFYGCSGIESVILPNSLEKYEGHVGGHETPASIGKFAFYGCSGLTKVVSLKETVPTCSNFAFNEKIYANATLCIPTTALREYQTTDPWRKFLKVGSLEPLSAIEFLEANVVCPLGGTVRLFLKKSPAGSTDDITFISGNTAVATVDANGVVTGVAKGSTAIIAMSGTLTASCVVTVEDPTIAATALEFEGIIGNVGETVAIGAKVLPEDVTDPTINWSSSNPEVAAVDADGVVWFNSAGNATVTAECQGYEISVPFVVHEVVARALNVFPVEAVGGVGHQFSLLALHEPENTTDKSVTWESSDPEVATVSEDGRVSLASLGSAKITARSGDHTAVCAVTVDDTVGLTEMASSGVVIDIVEGGIIVRNAPVGEMIAVYAVDGKAVNGAVVESDETRLNLATGIYIVKVSPLSRPEKS